MASLSERIAQLALSQYEKLPPKYKPHVGSDGRREWTPLSAVVLAHGPQQELKCISLATGTKCLAASSISKCNGLVLHDCHAEVLALRGFNNWLLSEIRRILHESGYISPFIVPNSTPAREPVENGNFALTTPPFMLRDQISIHFFTTQAPCGDASMEILMNSMDPQAAEPWPVNDHGASTQALQGRGHFSMLGYVRRKPARADAESSLSKSCTDKLAMKQFTSIISFPADLYVEKTDNAFIRTMVVYPDQYNEVGYSRAFSSHGRLSNLKDRGKFFEVQQLPSDFRRFSFGKPLDLPGEESRPKVKAASVSSVWVAGPQGANCDVQEVLINGVKQGYKQWDPRIGKASVVSRKKMVKLAQELNVGDSTMWRPPTTPSSIPHEDFRYISSIINMRTYEQVKSSPSRTQSLIMKEYVKAALGNWPKNLGDEDWPCD